MQQRRQGQISGFLRNRHLTQKIVPNLILAIATGRPDNLSLLGEEEEESTRSGRRVFTASVRSLYMDNFPLCVFGLF